MTGIFEIQSFFWQHRVSIVIGLSGPLFKTPPNILETLTYQVYILSVPTAPPAATDRRPQTVLNEVVSSFWIRTGDRYASLGPPL